MMKPFGFDGTVFDSGFRKDCIHEKYMVHKRKIRAVICDIAESN